MVITTKRAFRIREAGALTTELVIALAILASTMIPLSFSFLREQKLLRLSYERAVAMEIVDGEMEILQAGEWKAWPEGAQTYTAPTRAAKNLPAGNLTLTRQGERFRLEWKSKGVRVVREGKAR